MGPTEKSEVGGLTIQSWAAFVLLEREQDELHSKLKVRVLGVLGRLGSQASRVKGTAVRRGTQGEVRCGRELTRSRAGAALGRGPNGP